MSKLRRTNIFDAFQETLPSERTNLINIHKKIVTIQLCRQLIVHFRYRVK